MVLGRLAQLVERFFDVEKVTGSNPVPPTRMKILAIETSCDETAVSVINAQGGLNRPKFEILAHLVASQADLHAPYGGVVPSLAKREHGRNLIPLLIAALKQAKLTNPGSRQRDNLTIGLAEQVRQIFDHESELLERFLTVIPGIKAPAIDLLAVTQGPGLEPALWTGINFARALSLVWNIPLLPINHLEGHALAVLNNNHKINFPALVLLISGGHTQLVLMKDWLRYQTIGETRDDAAGEAFDKVARILDLPYPGGPQIARLASLGTPKEAYRLPRPMINTNDFDFSFSGLKTAALYLVKKIQPLTQITKTEIAYEFQQAVIDVLIHKTLQAVKRYQPKTLIVGGGVANNVELGKQLERKLTQEYPKTTLLLPTPDLSTDNATMIAIAAYCRSLKYPKTKTQKKSPTIVARGTLPLK